MSVFTSATYFNCIDNATSLAASFGAGLDTPVILFCEDKLTLSVEKSLVKKVGGAFGAEVLSFGRYLQKAFPNRKTLSKEGSAMVVKKILTKLNGELLAFRKTGSSPSLSVKTAELIAQLKSAKVSPTALFDCVNLCPDNVKAKIHDVAIIYRDYEDFLFQNGLTDSSNSLSDMIPALEKDERIKKARVIFVGYSSVTKQSCDVMKKILSLASSCDFFAVTGANKDLYTDEFLNFAINLTGQNPTPCKDCLSVEASSILNGIFNPEYFSKVGLYSDKTHFFEAKDISDEADFICATIRKKILDGYRYQDIAIGVSNFADYKTVIERKLKDYEIPFFSDDKKTLLSHPFSRLVNALVKSALKKLDLTEIKKVITNSLFIADKSISDLFIRLLTENSVTPTSFINEDDFVKSLENCDDLAFERGVILQKQHELSCFIKSFPKKATASEFVNLVSTFAKNCSGVDREESGTNYDVLLKKLVSYGADEEKSFLTSGKTTFFNLLDEIKNILGNEIITGDEFLKLLCSGEEASEISLIPEHVDCVYLSELKNCRHKKYSCLFAVGLNGEVPSVKADSALLLDSDIASLDALSVSVEPKIRVVNNREKEATGVALASFENDFYASYSLTSASGKATVRSDLFDYLLNIFSSKDKKAKPLTRNSFYKPTGDEKTDNLRESYPYLALRPALFSLLSDSDDFKNGATDSLLGVAAFYGALKEFKGGEFIPLADLLIGNVNAPLKTTIKFPVSNYFTRRQVSATTIENFYICPYKCFIKYGVGVSESLDPEIKALDFGNVLHAVAELFSPEIDKMQSEEDCKKKADELVDKLFENEPKYKRFLKREDNAYSYYLTKKEAQKLCVDLYRQSKNSDFKTIGSEVWFADWGDTKYKALPLKTKDGYYKLHGKVDRVDRYGDYVRIIDYKTGNAKNKSQDKKFYLGQNIQLYLYLNAFTPNGEKYAGAYYYAVNDNFSSEDEKPIAMYGKTVLNEDVILASDKSLTPDQKKSSSIIEVKRKSTKSKGMTLSGNLTDETTLNGYVKYAKLITEKALDHIINGVAVPSPYEGACAYCEYGSICGKDEGDGYKERSVSNVNAETILKAVQTEENSSDKTAKNEKTDNLDQTKSSGDDGYGK
ncbi:MAG: PD-(D/E)XK nuclease family protein [Clostridia bacterium]|nr:PD-(D/E)XK nuclease family protein [Clostridia bacterium]